MKTLLRICLLLVFTNVICNALLHLWYTTRNNNFLPLQCCCIWPCGNFLQWANFFLARIHKQHEQLKWFFWPFCRIFLNFTQYHWQIHNLFVFMTYLFCLYSIYGISLCQSCSEMVSISPGIRFVDIVPKFLISMGVVGFPGWFPIWPKEFFFRRSLQEKLTFLIVLFPSSGHLFKSLDDGRV